ncbi:MAG: hypothetical protein WBA91_00325 [Paracoccaceae bacterium]
MLAKIAVLFLIIMAVLGLWGRFSTRRPRGQFCSYCGKARPCGCPKGAA